MLDFSGKTVCVIDNGLFAEFAATLAQSFGRVYLYIPWENAYPKSNQLLIGTGLEGVQKLDEFWSHLDEIDLFVFPDIYFGSLQNHLRSIGKRVWGSAMGEELELFRVFSKGVTADQGLGVGKFSVVTGVKALRKFLQKHDNQFVKISRTRGDMETFKAENYNLVEPKIDELEHKLGAKKELMEFIVEEAIEDAVEVGYDGFCVDGMFPSQAMSGIEIKDKGYIGHFKRYEEMAQPIRDVNEGFSEVLREYKYRNFWSAEARITRDGTPWVIDPCCRAGSPPSELQMLMYSNLAEIFWWGAEGQVIDPEPAAEWGAEIMMVSSWANLNWQSIEFPPALRVNVKLHFPVRIDGKFYVTPQGFDLPCIGAVVAVGDTFQKAANACKKIASEVSGYFVDMDLNVFDSAKEEIESLAEFGFEL